MDKLNNGIVTIIGILLLLPLIGVDQLGAIVGESSVSSWLVVIGVLVIGIKGLLGK